MMMMMMIMIMMMMIYYNINPTVSPLSLIKLEQAWLYRLWFKEGRYITRPDWEYLFTALVPRRFVAFFPPVTMKWSPTSIPHASLQCNVIVMIIDKLEVPHLSW